MTNHLEQLAQQVALINGMTIDEARARLQRDLAAPPTPVMVASTRPIWPPSQAEPDHIGAHLRLPPTWLPAQPDQGCRCTRPSRDNRYVCDDCGDLLSAALAEVPWAIEQLDISIARQRAASTSGSARSTETPLPWHDKAAEQRHVLVALLAHWVRYCDRLNLQHSSPADGLPTDNPVSMARWLLWRVDALTLNINGSDAVEETVRAVNEARRIVLWKHRSRIYLGPCKNHLFCAGEVYADEDADTGACDQCAITYPVSETRANLEAELDDRLFTAAEIAHLATYLGLSAPRESVRKVINQWHTRTRIAGIESPDAEVRFRYGDVAPLLSVAYGETKGASA